MLRDFLSIWAALVIFGGTERLSAQPDPPLHYQIVIAGDDTMMVVSLGEAVVTSNLRHYYQDRKRYLRLEQRVLKVYPYAQAAGELMEGYAAEMSRLKTERERRKYLDRAEDQLKEKFEGEIRNMTIGEGLVLIKLIDRQTGDSSYELLRELRGGFNAFVWQSVARLFGTNLKEEYDPIVEDRIIEDIVLRIESGELCVSDKVVDVPPARRKGR